MDRNKIYSAQAIIILASLFFVFFPSCSYEYQVQIKPQQSEILLNGIRVENNTSYKTSEKEITVTASLKGYRPYSDIIKAASRFSPKVVDIALKKKTYPFSLSILPQSVKKARISIDGAAPVKAPYAAMLPQGKHSVEISAPGYQVQRYYVFLNNIKDMTIRLQKSDIDAFNKSASGLFLRPKGVYTCRHAPKQSTFGPDSRYIYLTYLFDKGGEIFDTHTGQFIHSIDPGKHTADTQFTEQCFIPSKHRYLATQMTTGSIFEYDISAFAKKTTVSTTETAYGKRETAESVSNQTQPRFIRVISSGGEWPKYMAYSEPLDILAVSNWKSNTVALIKHDTGTIQTKVGPIASPRGLVFSPNGKFLYITSFDGGTIHKYETDTWTETARVRRPFGAMRHAVLSTDGSTLYVSDMANEKVYSIDAQNFTIKTSYTVPVNPNTIDLTPDGRYLFVSCRGPNNPDSYLLKSPEPGKIYIIDTKQDKIIFHLNAGTQPTGLDISSNGSHLVFTNFQDDTFEIYQIK